MNNLVKIFEFEGNNITFRDDTGKLMINATQMALPFNKNPWKWLELPSTKDYLKALSENRSLAENQLVMSVKGGNNPNKRGNWFHEDLAIEFARWLSPKFAIWCNDRIKEILTGQIKLEKPISEYHQQLAINREEKLKDSLLRSKIETQVLKMAFAAKVDEGEAWMILYQIIYAKYKLDFWAQKKPHEKNIDVFQRLKILNLLFIESKYDNLETFLEFKQRKPVYPEHYLKNYYAK